MTLGLRGTRDAGNSCTLSVAVRVSQYLLGPTVIRWRCHCMKIEIVYLLQSISLEKILRHFLLNILIKLIYESDLVRPYSIQLD